MSSQIGRSSPNGKASTPTTAQGMTTSDTSGTASALPMSPNGLRAWKWKLPKGAVARLATSVVATSAKPAKASQRKARPTAPAGSAGGKRPRAHSAAAIRAATAAYDIWKLGPSSASGSRASTMSADSARLRMLSAGRSTRTAPSMTRVMTSARSVATSDPEKTQ